MTYRGDVEALRARLEAIEQRLHETEQELADAKRRLEGSLEPVAPPPASRRVGHPLPPPGDVSVGRSLIGVGGAVLSLMGVAFVLWNVPGADQLGEVAITLAMALAFFLGPGGLLMWLSLRTTRPRHKPMVEARRVRVAAPADAAEEPEEQEDERTGDRQQATGNRQ